MSIIEIIISTFIGISIGIIIGLSFRMLRSIRSFLKKFISFGKRFFLVMPGQKYLLEGAGLMIVTDVFGSDIELCPPEQFRKYRFDRQTIKVDRLAFAASSSLIEDDEFIALEAIRNEKF